MFCEYPDCYLTSSQVHSPKHTICHSDCVTVVLDPVFHSDDTSSRYTFNKGGFNTLMKLKLESK